MFNFKKRQPQPSVEAILDEVAELRGAINDWDTLPYQSEKVRYVGYQLSRLHPQLDYAEGYVDTHPKMSEHFLKPTRNILGEWEAYYLDEE